MLLGMNKKTDPATVYAPCGKCGGRGSLPQLQTWRSRAGGRCFTCKGTGRIAHDAAAARRDAVETIAKLLRDADAKFAEDRPFAAEHYLHEVDCFLAHRREWPADVRARAESAVAQRRAKIEAASAAGRPR